VGIDLVRLGFGFDTSDQRVIARKSS